MVINFLLPYFGGIAHLVERLNGIQKVAGSTPTTSTNEKRRPRGASFFVGGGSKHSKGVFPPVRARARKALRYNII